MKIEERHTLPSIDALLRDPQVLELMTIVPRSTVVAAVRHAVHRARVRRAGAPGNWAAEIADLVMARVTPSLGPVVNATGIVLHTNLGRAPLAAQAIEAIDAIATGYSALEFDLHSGTRGSRSDHCRVPLRRLTGAEDALVVNNAAGALVLALNTVALDREVLISRGELIEIGGSFRIPEILEKSGARLREIGTTNRTHLDDYRDALGPETGAILTVHRSNFEQRGFIATPDPRELAMLAHDAGVPYLYDVGSGLLADVSAYGLDGEPKVSDAVAAGAELVIFSGDKLLGGPQAGCLVGRNALIRGCRRNPMARALRADKFTLAGLEATLALYDDPATARHEIPVLRMLTEEMASLEHRAALLAAACPTRVGAHVVAGESAVGGGAFPGATLRTALVSLEEATIGANGLALRLRLGHPAVVARVSGDRVLLDVRTMTEDDVAQTAAALQEIVDQLEQERHA